MTRRTSTNYTGAHSFTYADAVGDAFARTDVQQLAASVDNHDHTSGNGILIAQGLALISSQTFASPASNVTFSSIPGTYRGLRLVWLARCDLTAAAVFAARFNGDSGNNYAGTGYDFNSSSFANPANLARIGVMAGTPTTAGEFSGGEVVLPFYAQTTTRKMWIANSFRSDATMGEVCNGIWRNTAAITSIAITTDVGTGNLLTGSQFALYGML